MTTLDEMTDAEIDHMVGNCDPGKNPVAAGYLVNNLWHALARLRRLVRYPAANESLPKLLRAMAASEYANEHKHDMILTVAAEEIERSRRLIKALLDTDPNDCAADGVTVLDVWRENARSLFNH